MELKNGGYEWFQVGILISMVDPVYNLRRGRGI